MANSHSLVSMSSAYDFLAIVNPAGVSVLVAAVEAFLAESLLGDLPSAHIVVIVGPIDSGLLDVCHGERSEIDGQVVSEIRFGEFHAQ